MRKLLALVIVLAFVSTASAASVRFEVAPGTPTFGGGGSYSFGQVITINLIADFAVQSFSVSIAGNYGTAVAAGPVNADFVVFPNSGTMNTGGNLITGATGAVAFGSPNVDAEEILYSFDYLVPHLPYSTNIVIDDVGFVSILGGGTSIDDVDAFVVHTPEPMTIGLLGLGGLFLRRRK